MDITILKNKFKTQLFGAIAFCSIITIFSCSKDKQENPSSLEFHKLYRIENLYTIQENTSPMEMKPFYYSLENKKSVNESKAQSDQWDIRFDGVFNGYISANIVGEIGNTGTGNGGIIILEKSFEEVTDIPSDALFSQQKGSVGPDDAGAFGKGKGWFIYDFEGTVVRDGSFNNQHVAYALGNSITLKNGNQTIPRTIIVKTAKGNYAKIKILSVYKDMLHPKDWFRESPKMYLTFEYVLAPAGSKKFEIR